MKRYIRNTSNPLEFDIEVVADHPLLYLSDSDMLSAAIDLDNFQLPDRPVISQDRNRITGWMIDDFESFAQSVESLCEENYDLTLTYRNTSEDHSHYYNYLATDSEGNVIVKFRLRLRISNDDAHSTPQQKQNKRNELKSEKLRQLLSDPQIKKLRNYYLDLKVNGERYTSYHDALEDIDAAIGNAVEVMKRGTK